MKRSGTFPKDCKYDGDKPTDGQQAQGGQSSFDSYDPVVGKWMTNLVATTPITAKAMKNLYTELNRQKDLKWTYRKKYKDWQVIVTTITEPHVTLQQPVVVTSSTVNAKPQILKNLLERDTGPSANLRGRNKDRAKVTAALIQELTEEL